MKKYTIFGFLLMIGLMFAMSSALTSAEDNDTTTKDRQLFNQETKEKRQDFKEDWSAKREELRGKMETDRKAFGENLKTEREKFLAEVKAKREEFKSANSEKKVRFCEAARHMVGQRFEAATTNLERIQNRVNAVIEKLNADGKDTDLAEETLALSKQKLAEAKVKIKEIRDLIPENCENVTPELFAQIKVLAREAKDLLKESRENLHQTILEIKDLRGEKSEDESESD